MFKLFLFAAMVAFAAAKPGFGVPLAYSAAPVAAYSAPLSYSAPLTYSAYSAPFGYSAYSAPLTYASPYSAYYYR